MAVVANDRGRATWDLPGSRQDDLTVGDLLHAPSLAESVVLAGHDGLGRAVRRLNVMEVPDILPWVKPNEFILTTAYALTRADASAHAGLLLDLVTELNARGLAAIGVKLGRYLDAIPPEVLDRANELAFPILRLPRMVAFDEILSEIFSELVDRQARVLAQADAIHRTISAIVLAGGRLQQIAEEVSRVLGCDILIASPEGRVLAEDGDAGARGALEAADLVTANGAIRVGRLRAGVHRLGDAGASTAATIAATPIVAAGTEHGWVLAYRRNGALPAGAEQALERTAIVAALSITKELAVIAAEGKFRGDYLHDILTGLTPVDGAAVEHCRALGWSIDHPMVVAVAEVDRAAEGTAEWPAMGARSETERLAAAWQHALRTRDKTIPVVGFSQEVVSLIPVGQSDPVALVNEIVNAIASTRDGAPFSTGVSRVVSRPADISLAYDQARRAVRVGRRMRGPGSTSHFDSLGVHRVLSLVPDAGELRSFSTEVLGELAMDTPAAADLRHTLQTLLDTNLNVAETARLLHFHYNTLRYRITKLERIIGPFTADPHLRLDVALAMRVLEMHGT